MRTNLLRASLFAAAVMLGGSACSGDDTAGTTDAHVDPPDTTALLREKVKTVVVIYAENRGFDNIYGTFPGANGIPGVNPTSMGTIHPQLDRDAAQTPLAKLPQAWGGVTATGFAPAITQAMSDNLPNAPYSWSIHVVPSTGNTSPPSSIVPDAARRVSEK